jgi:predicted aldo/keto reductase-like oxidoreductase
VELGGSTPDDLRRRFFRCLERLQTDYVDCLMIHQTPRLEQVGHEDFHSTFQQLKAEGKVRFLGLSNHGIEQSWWGPMDVRMEDVLGAAVEDGRFDMALFVYNFLQKEQGERIIKMCQTRNMGVTLMKTDPINLYASIRESIDQTEQRGRRVSEARQKIAKDYEAYVAQAEAFKQKFGIQSEAQARSAATKFVLAHPGVHSVCPSINTFDGLEAFVALSGQKLSDGEEDMLNGYEEMLGRYYCRHACGICESSCPERVPVNTVLRYNHYFEAHGREKQAMQKYANLAAEAQHCLDCPGLCESACPYGIPVRSLLVRAHSNLTLS